MEISHQVRYAPPDLSGGSFFNFSERALPRIRWSEQGQRILEYNIVLRVSAIPLRFRRFLCVEIYQPQRMQSTRKVSQREGLQIKNVYFVVQNCTNYHE